MAVGDSEAGRESWGEALAVLRHMQHKRRAEERVAVYGVHAEMRNQRSLYITLSLQPSLFHRPQPVLIRFTLPHPSPPFYLILPLHSLLIDGQVDMPHVQILTRSILHLSRDRRIHGAS
jgi:hypothetical protein